MQHPPQHQTQPQPQPQSQPQPQPQQQQQQVVTPAFSIDLQTKQLRKQVQQIILVANRIVSEDPSKRAHSCLDLSQKLEEFELFCDDVYAYIEINKQNIIYNNVNNGGYDRNDSPELLYQSLNLRLSSVKQTRNTVERFCKQIASMQQQLTNHNNTYKEAQVKAEQELQLQQQQQQQQQQLQQQQDNQQQLQQESTMIDIDIDLGQQDIATDQPQEDITTTTATTTSDGNDDQQQLQQQQDNQQPQEQQATDQLQQQQQLQQPGNNQTNSPSVYSPSFLKNSTGDHQGTPTISEHSQQQQLTPSQGGSTFNPLSPGSMNMPSPTPAGLSKKSPTSVMMDGSYDTPSQQHSQLTPSQQHSQLTPSQTLSQLTPSQHNQLTPSQHHLQQIAEEVDSQMVEPGFSVTDDTLQQSQQQQDTNDQQNPQEQLQIDNQQPQEQQQEQPQQQTELQQQLERQLQEQMQNAQNDPTQDEAIENLVNEELNLAQQPPQQQQLQPPPSQDNQNNQQPQELEQQIDMIDVDLENTTFEQPDFSNNSNNNEVVDLDGDNKPMTTDEIEGNLEQINQDVAQQFDQQQDMQHLQQQDQGEQQNITSGGVGGGDEDEIEMEEVVEVNPDEFESMLEEQSESTNTEQQ